MKHKIYGFIVGLLLCPLIVWAGLESGVYISDLVVTNPTGSDNRSTADDHLRLIKSTIKNTFPNITGAVTATHTQLNYVTGVTSAIQTQLNALPAYTTGSYTGTLTGCTTSPTATIKYSKIGNVVTIYVPTVNATSNSAALTITGGPAAIQPVSQVMVPLAIGALFDSGSGFQSNAVFISAGSSTIQFMKNASTGGFSNSGAKGTNIEFSFSYFAG
jgi:hypothetical protein